MIEVTFGAVIFVCGAFIGFMVAGLFPSWREEPEDFDGGYLHDNKPRAVTRIHSADLDWEIK